MKNIKKLLAQQKSEILPDDKIKDNIKQGVMLIIWNNY